MAEPDERLDEGEVLLADYVLKVDPFNWPRHPDEPLELQGSGMSEDVRVALDALCAGSERGTVHRTLDGGVLVEYAGGGPTPQPVAVRDWRGNEGRFAWYPGTAFSRTPLGYSGPYIFRIKLVLLPNG